MSCRLIDGTRISNCDECFGRLGFAMTNDGKTSDAARRRDRSSVQQLNQVFEITVRRQALKCARGSSWKWGVAVALTAVAAGMRGRMVMLSTQGHSLREIAWRLGANKRTVCLWRRRYQ